MLQETAKFIQPKIYLLETFFSQLLNKIITITSDNSQIHNPANFLTIMNLASNLHEQIPIVYSKELQTGKLTLDTITDIYSLLKHTYQNKNIAFNMQTTNYIVQIILYATEFGRLNDSNILNLITQNKNFIQYLLNNKIDDPFSYIENHIQFKLTNITRALENFVYIECNTKQIDKAYKILEQKIKKTDQKLQNVFLDFFNQSTINNILHIQTIELENQAINFFNTKTQAELQNDELFGKLTNNLSSYFITIRSIIEQQKISKTALDKITKIFTKLDSVSLYLKLSSVSPNNRTICLQLQSKTLSIIERQINVTHKKIIELIDNITIQKNFIVHRFVNPSRISTNFNLLQKEFNMLKI